MSNFILITDKTGKDIIIKKSSIKKVYPNTTGSIVSLSGRLEAPIHVTETVKEFYSNLN